MTQEQWKRRARFLSTLVAPVIVAACSGSDTVRPTPAVVVEATALPEGVVGSAYGHALAATGGDGSFAWSLVSGSLPPGLDLSPEGVLSGTPSRVGSWDFLVRVHSGDQSTTAALEITVVDPVAITTPALPLGRTGRPYSVTLSATGGTGAYAWSVASGGLPAGLALDASGLLSGTPAAPGAREVTVQVVSGEQTVVRAMPLAVFDPLDVATTGLADGVVGVPYSGTLDADGGAGPYVWGVTEGDLPQGLLLDTAGVVSGIPAAAGTASFTVSVGSSDETASRTFQLAVFEPLVIETSSLPEAVGAAPYRYGLVARGGAGTVEWSIPAGGLPPGLQLSEEGMVAGTPTETGSFSLTVQAVSGSQTVSRNFDLTVVDELTITTETLEPGVVGEAYSETLAATGGGGATTWSLSSGTLPEGVALDPAGEIGGTPTEAGDFTFTVEVARGSQAADREYTVRIDPASCDPDGIPDTDGDRLADCAETNTGVYRGPADTGTSPILADTDGDGIDDGDEVLGTVDGLNLPAMGVNPLQQNILIEYDWFDDSETIGLHSHRPSASTVAKVAAAFAAAPVANPDGSTGIVAIQDYGQGGPFTGGSVLADPDGCIVGGVGGAEYAGHLAGGFAANRLGYFHYSLVIHRYNADAPGSCGGSSGNSGQAFYNDHRSVIASGTWHDGGSGDQYVANTILHELGHNLNLSHGGARSGVQSGLNYKPNYNSVMNYRYQFSGVDTGCDVTADDFLDYSRGTRITLDESRVDETVGVCGDVPIDWNDDGDAGDVGASQDLQAYDDGAGSGSGNGSSTDVLEDYDDWANITLATSVAGAALPVGAYVFKEVETCTAAPPTPGGG